MPVPWNEDDPRDLPVIADNLRQILRRIVDQAQLRPPPTVVMVQEWHRLAFRGVVLPVSYYAGEVRDSDPEFPELWGYEVAVGRLPGVPSRLVPEELDRLERSLQRAVGILDPLIPVNDRPLDSARLHSVLTLCAYAHGEWVRIHPFANGNGTAARLLSNWCALRYALPPFVQLHPRPAGDDYVRAAADSMRGDHRTMVGEFARMLSQALRRRS